MDCYCLGLGCWTRWTPPQQTQLNKRQRSKSLQLEHILYITKCRTHREGRKIWKYCGTIFYSFTEMGTKELKTVSYALWVKKHQKRRASVLLHVSLPSKISEACSLAVVLVMCWMLQSAENLRRKHKLLGEDVTWRWSKWRRKSRETEAFNQDVIWHVYSSHGKYKTSPSHIWRRRRYETKRGASSERRLGCEPERTQGANNETSRTNRAVWILILFHRSSAGVTVASNLRCSLPFQVSFEKGPPLYFEARFILTQFMNLWNLPAHMIWM